MSRFLILLAISASLITFSNLSAEARILNAEDGVRVSIRFDAQKRAWLEPGNSDTPAGFSFNSKIEGVSMYAIEYLAALDQSKTYDCAILKAFVKPFAPYVNVYYTQDLVCDGVAPIEFERQAIQ